jgi:hypothetical protein
MALLRKQSGVQDVLVAEFVWNWDDTMVDINGVTRDFKTIVTGIVADVINLPPNAIVVGGEVVTEIAVTGATAYNVSVGDSASAVRYLGATNKLAAGRTVLVPTGYVGLGENIRLTALPTVADATAGKISLRVEYVLRNRAIEASTH